MSEELTRSQKNRIGNHSARLAAVQALYQMEIADRGADAVVKEFLDHRLNACASQEVDVIVNRKLFEAIVRITYDKHLQIDDFIIASLPESWSIDRLDTVLRAIMRAACGEFLMDKNLAAAVIINEYVNVTRDFYSEREPGFVNGVLDHIAHTLGLKMKDEPEAEIKDMAEGKDTSGTTNWEGEGGPVAD